MGASSSLLYKHDFLGVHGVHGERHFKHCHTKTGWGGMGWDGVRGLGGGVNSAQRQVTVEQNGITVDARGEKAWMDGNSLYSKLKHRCFLCPLRIFTVVFAWDGSQAARGKSLNMAVFALKHSISAHVQPSTFSTSVAADLHSPGLRPGSVVGRDKSRFSSLTLAR